MKPTTQRNWSLRAVLLLALALAGPVSAATITWTNTAGGNWTAATNWSPNLVPTTGDTAVVSGVGPFTIRVDGTVGVDSVILNNPNATLRPGHEAQRILRGGGQGQQPRRYETDHQRLPIHTISPFTAR